MTITDWLVIAGGAAAIVWVNWYFFMASRDASGAATLQSASHVAGADARMRAATPANVDSVTVVVDGG